LLKYYIIFMVERILSRMHEVKMELNTYFFDMFSVASRLMR